MTPQEKLKILSAYLPYKLRFLELFFKEESTLFKIDFEEEIYSTISDDDYEVYSSDGYDMKPILRDLSDLTKEIEHNGERFVPVEELNSIYSFDCSNEEMATHILKLEIDSMPYWLFEKLISWHFNVFSLPESEYIKKE